MMMTTTSTTMMMMMMIPSLAVAEESFCQLPHLENGLVEIKEKTGEQSFVFTYKCNPGFKLSSQNPQVKCKGLDWSHKPVCIVSNCDPQLLPDIANGRKQRVKHMRNGMYRYYCNRGYKLIGEKTVYCDKTGWDMKTNPVCALSKREKIEAACDETELLGQGLKGGDIKKVPKYHGGYYRFTCDTGYTMSGSQAVFCNDKGWNGSIPHCLAPDQAPSTPELDIKYPEGDYLATVGQRISLQCSTRGGNPRPELTFLLGGSPVKPDIQERQEEEEQEEEDVALLSLLVSPDHDSMEVACTAENRVTPLPLSSDKLTVYIKRPPSKVHINGTLEPRQFEEARYVCYYEESNPAADISVTVFDQDGAVLAVDTERIPPLKTPAGWASQVKFSFLPVNCSGLQIVCTANNSAGEATETRELLVIEPPTELTLTGASEQVRGGDAVLSCQLDSRGYNVTQLSWVLEKQEEDEEEEDVTLLPILVSEPEEADGEMRTELRLADYMPLMENNMTELSVFCVATLSKPDITLTSDSLHVRLVGEPEVTVTGPSMLLVSETNRIMCSSSEVSAEDLLWSITDQAGTLIELTGSSSYTSGQLAVLEVSGDRNYQAIRVTCTATNLAGTSSDQITVQIAEEPDQVDLSLPEYGLVGLPLNFLCSTPAVHPAPALSWSVQDWEGDEVEGEESQTVEVEGQLTSSLSLPPQDFARRLEVSCRAENSVGYREVEANVSLSYLSVSVAGVEEGENVIQGTELSLLCSVELLPGLTSVQWLTNGEQVSSEPLETEGGRLVSRLDWVAHTIEEIVVQCLPGLGESQASVRFNVVEYQYSDKEEIVLTEEPRDATVNNDNDNDNDNDHDNDEDEEDATRAEAAPQQLPQDSDRSSGLEALTPGLRTLRSSAQTSQASGLAVLTVTLICLLFDQ